MLNRYLFLALSCMLFSFSAAFAQAFRKGSLLVSISGGDTYANFSTCNRGNGEVKGDNQNMDGIRDPLIIEYGITDQIGIGFSSGVDYYKVDPVAFYGFQSAHEKVRIATKEITGDVNYHFFTSNVIDLSCYGSLGLFNTSFEDKTMGNNKNKSTGGIARAGTRARVYVYKGLAVMFMFSTFTSSATAKYSTETTAGKAYNTNIKGYATEFGLSYHIKPKLPKGPALKK